MKEKWTKVEELAQMTCIMSDTDTRDSFTSDFVPGEDPKIIVDYMDQNFDNHSPKNQQNDAFGAEAFQQEKASNTISIS